MRTSLLYGYFLLLLVGALFMTPDVSTAGDWKTILAERLPLLGHRNWIVVVDAAYPAQTSPGVEVVLCEDFQIDVVHGVLEELARAKHVRPVVYLDKELDHVAEKDAPGITEYRQKLGDLLGNLNKKTALHEKIIGKLDEAGKTFKILLLKTRLALPYTSVFFQLECGYWSDDAEKNLRKTMR
jgi:hypothetical protein